LLAWEYGGAAQVLTKTDALTALLLTRLLLLLSLPEEIIQGRIDPPLINVAPDRAIGSSNPISPVFSDDLHAIYGGPFPSVS
jgi:hypothetical protein